MAKHPAFLKKEVATICYSVIHGLLNFTREHLQETPMLLIIALSWDQMGIKTSLMPCVNLHSPQLNFGTLNLTITSSPFSAHLSEHMDPSCTPGHLYRIRSWTAVTWTHANNRVVDQIRFYWTFSGQMMTRSRILYFQKIENSASSFIF